MSAPLIMLLKPTTNAWALSKEKPTHWSGAIPIQGREEGTDMDEHCDTSPLSPACILFSTSRRSTFLFGALLLSILLGGFLAGA